MYGYVQLYLRNHDIVSNNTPTQIFHMLLIRLEIVQASKLVKVTAVVGLWGWTAVFLSIASLLMFIRCSSKDSGYVNMSGGIKNNADVEGSLLTIDLTNTASWSGNWSQLCPTCKEFGHQYPHYKVKNLGFIMSFLNILVPLNFSKLYTLLALIE
ncbi:hypothetical protein L1887_32693 [Cichorium endivia]|nr:hypothetical protein L1887_32693 [Cichorium endivia]